MGGLAIERFILRPETFKRYRAAWVFGAGLVGSHFKPAQVNWLAEMPFFEAVGEKDFNRRAVETMLPKFQETLKKMEFHVMPGMGHQIDIKNYGPKLLDFFRKNLPEVPQDKDVNKASK